jgi:hypothetical protein
LNDSGNEISAGFISNNRNGSDDNSQSRSTSRSIIAAFGRRPGDNKGRENAFDKTISIIITVSTSSICAFCIAYIRKSS